MRFLLACLCISLLVVPMRSVADPAVPIQKSETQEHRDARMAWWRAARFGMFIHWGMYAQAGGFWKGKKIGGLGEWLMRYGKVPVADYKLMAHDFNPTKFDANTWVSVAKEAGMKYIVITAKHHDGFAMFKSNASTFNIVDDTPFKRDPLMELRDACLKQDMKLGFYYSQDQDWTTPGGGSMDGPHWDKAQDGDFEKYLHEKAIPQIKELLTNYQPFPSVLWFDTPTRNMTQATASEIVEVLNQHPNLIWNNRLGGGYVGDTETPEQFIPAGGFPGKDWETCMTINDTWGYRSDDHNFKSSDMLLRNLIDIAGTGGNYLLNIGPDPTGVIPQPEVDVLLAIGKWLKINGEAIYGTQGGPFPTRIPGVGVTQKPGKLYLTVMDWPKDGTIHLPLFTGVTKGYFLTQPDKAVSTTAVAPDEVVVHLPGPAPDPFPTVIVLELTGPPLVAATRQAADGTLVLGAGTCRVEGKTLHQENDPPDLADWRLNSTDSAHWLVQITKPGKYNVAVNYSLEPAGNGGSTLTLTAGDQSLAMPLHPTKSWNDYETVNPGAIQLPAGRVSFDLTGVAHNGYGMGNLRTLTLSPAP